MRFWSMDSCLRSPALSQVYLSLTFQLLQTAVVTFEMNSTFWTVPVKLNSYNFSMKNSCVQWVAKDFAIVLAYLFDSDLQYNLTQGWRHAFGGYCNHCSGRKLNNWLQCWSSLRYCNQSVHVYQNCLEQSQKHVCQGAYDHYNYMETRLYLRCNKLKLSNSHVGVLIDLTIKWYFIELEQLNKANWNINDLQWTIHMPIKLTSTLEGELIVEIIRVKSGHYIGRKDRKHMVANMFFKLSRYVLVFT